MFSSERESQRGSCERSCKRWRLSYGSDDQARVKTPSGSLAQKLCGVVRSVRRDHAGCKSQSPFRRAEFRSAAGTEERGRWEPGPRCEARGIVSRSPEKHVPRPTRSLPACARVFRTVEGPTDCGEGACTTGVAVRFWPPSVWESGGLLQRR